MSDKQLYAGRHQALRRALDPYVPGSPCWRCGRPILPGQPWDLGHDDDNPAIYRGPEHAVCNRAAGARKGNARRRERRRRIMDKVTEAALGIELSEDRSCCSIVAAGRLEHEMVLVELVAYLNGPATTVGTVLELRAARKIIGVVVDPMSNAVNLIKPLRAAGVEVTEPGASDVKAAHGSFLDLLAAGRLRHLGQTELTAAMRHLQQRPMGGAQVFERRGAMADVSPAVAAELAVWGLSTAPQDYDVLSSIW